MNIDAIPVGKNPPEDFNVIIENPMGGAPIKYEMEKESGAIRVDRFMQTAMHYPANYGFIPHTLSGDGDPVDVVVLTHVPIMPGAVISCRAVGVFIMKDESGMDEKIIAVPVDKLNPFYHKLQSIDDMDPALRNQIEHFFAHYKDLESGKWSETIGWEGPDKARALIVEGVDRA
ncbi:MAG: inorganic diphosphatase [Alphaproteobacteria bacterium]|nr:inorganic diphosphatase [Alphaproteobacteria bacterium]